MNDEVSRFSSPLLSGLRAWVGCEAEVGFVAVIKRFKAKVFTTLVMVIWKFFSIAKVLIDLTTAEESSDLASHEPLPAPH
jgi:hypothetical protein